MTDPKPKLKIYPSSSGFLTDKGLEIEYNSACQRYMVANIGANRKDLDPIYGILGQKHEDWYEGQLGRLLKERELPIKFDLTPEIEYSGRADFTTHDGAVHETKASMSKDFLYKVIRKGIPKTSHLAQTVSYMIQLKTDQAYIVTGFYTEEMVLKEHRVFNVRVLENGYITVDGKHTGYNVSHQIAHLMASAKALETKQLPARPHNYLEWSSACTFCPLKKLCSKYDFGQVSDEEFKEQGRELINAEPVKMRKSTKKA